MGDGAGERGRPDGGVAAGHDVGKVVSAVADAIGEPDVHGLADEATEGGADLEARLPDGKI